MTAQAQKPTTRMSTKGQVILPKAVRQRRGWKAGTRLVVEERPEGVLLTAEPLFPPTTVEEAYGILKYDGPPVSVEQMKAAVLAEAARRYLSLKDEGD
ncbi:MAG TPA: AbrB family transcriptional regulator [Methylocystis sp.]|nr:AbrB family transcriptional regulator [Methylocystis sp.]